ncbi:hypothetical protein FB45DRAFT_925310 [Roridomyces roridus]|uniref:Peptidase M20 dimerisation domain-containing protein n=1 Tax=Roridomyces roridus TaxID=1738132 RepID=A0AAD7BJS2_9AGAR|nr:hypothetical protein FB45DRAFT_925310 [Roridomyces roridus]
MLAGMAKRFSTGQSLDLTPMGEKSLLPQSTPRQEPGRRYRYLLATTLVVISFYLLSRDNALYLNVGRGQHLAAGCSQVAPVTPERNAELLGKFSDVIGTPDFKTKAIDWLAGAVQVPTEVFDAMPDPGQDSRWEAFGPFHDYLLNAFPLVHSTLSLTKVNTYGLLFEWTGSDSSLKPILLAGHQDVVPVEPKTYADWTHPPYSGYYDGEFIWGRGSSDDKSGLIGIMTSIETLIGLDFKPTRTVVLAFGFDEEASGRHGAGALGEAMRDIYGDNHPFALIVDEGGGFAESYGTVVATPAVAEKGYLDVHVEVTSPGGHSSIPPEHTTIGILAALLVEYDNNPHPFELSRESIPYNTLQCLAEHGATMPKSFKKLIQHSAHSKHALRKLQDVLHEDKAYRSLIGTTQAIDIIQGGVKSNALPEQAYALVNHRISTQSSVAEVQAHDTALLKDLATKFNLTFTAFGTKLTEPPAYGTLEIKDAYGTALAPAPVSPIRGEGSEAYQLLSGTIKSTFSAHRAGLAGPKEVIVAPGMSTGNTDTRYYWQLSRSIFRYNHKNTIGADNRLRGVHTVNEAMSAEALLEMIRFFSTLILNADESTTV